MGEAQRTGRINLRVAPEIDQLLRAAAAVRHESLTSFLLDAACAKARETLEEEHRLRLSTETFNRVMDELERPGQVVEPLRDLFRRTAAWSAADAPEAVPTRRVAAHVDI